MTFKIFSVSIILFTLFSCSSTSEHYENGLIETLIPSKIYDDINPYFPLKKENRWTYTFEDSKGIRGMYSFKVLDTLTLKLNIGGKYQEVTTYKIYSKSSLSGEDSLLGLNCNNSTIIFKREGEMISEISQIIPRDISSDSSFQIYNCRKYKPEEKYIATNDKETLATRCIKNGNLEYSLNIKSSSSNPIQENVRYYEKDLGMYYWRSTLNPNLESNSSNEFIQADYFIIYELKGQTIN